MDPPAIPWGILRAWTGQDLLFLEILSSLENVRPGETMWDSCWRTLCWRLSANSTPGIWARQCCCQQAFTSLSFNMPVNEGADLNHRPAAGRRTVTSQHAAGSQLQFNPYPVRLRSKCRPETLKIHFVIFQRVPGYEMWPYRYIFGGRGEEKVESKSLLHCWYFSKFL